MLHRPHLLAFSTAGVLIAAGALMGLYAGCSPSSGNGDDGGIEAAPCAPGDMMCGTACDPSKVAPTDCYTGPAGTNAKGVCQTGKRSCLQNGTYSACIGEVTPSPEVCNYADDDCNGLVDDVQSIVEAGTLFNCNSPACTDFPDAAITCWGVDFGICGAGTLGCKGGPKGGSPTACIEFLHAGAPEVCNGIDDDCNGIIDDGLTNEGQCTLGPGHNWSEFPDADLTNLGKLAGDASPTAILGQCADAGQLSCTDFGCNAHYCADAGDICNPSAPTIEQCNGYDDDCNGKVDDHACKGSPYGQYCCTYGAGYGYCSSYNYGGCVLAN